MSSQYEEDAVISQFFGSHVGTFLDIGAGNGMKGSNSRQLILLGWSGWLIEPHAWQFADLYNLYRDTKTVKLFNGALSDHGHPIEFFHHADQLSTGRSASVEMKHMRPYFDGSYFIPTVTPQAFAQLSQCQFDFVSLDCEGMDLEILRRGASLLEGTKLLCYEHDLPGCEPDPGYRQEWEIALRSLGFTQVVGRTKANTLITRP